jgi:chromosome segregation ATPase
MNNAISTPEVKQALEKALTFKAELAKVQQELGNVNQQLRIITEDQGRLRANLREMPETAAAYKRYLEKFDKQETEIEDLQKQQKSFQTKELQARQALDGYLTSLNVK